LAALQIDYVLGQTSKSEVEQALRTLPSGLEQNLALTIHRIKSQDSQGNSRADLALRVLAWLSNSARPMGIEELNTAVAASLDDIEEGENVDSLVLVECCLGLVAVENITRNVRLIHMSINEYLQSHLSTLMPRANAIMAERCMNYLARCQAQCSKQAPLSNEEVNTIASSSHFLRYATSYWGSHARDGFDAELEKKVKDICANQPVVNFWANVFLYYNSIWRELLNPKNVYTNIHNKDLCYVTGKLSLLHIAAVHGIGDLFRHALDGRDTDVNVKDPFGRTPLILSAAHGTTSICELLLERNELDANAQDSTGNTALSIAVLCKRVEIARRLLERPGTDVNLGQPLSKATGYLYFQDMFPVAPVVPALQIAELLFSHDELDVNLVDANGYAPWEHISLDFNAETLQILLSRKDFEPSPKSVNRTIPGLQAYSSNREYRLHEVAHLVGAVRVLIAIENDERFAVDEFERCDLLISLAGIFYLAFASDHPHTEEADGTYKYKIADGPIIFDSSCGQMRGQVRAGLESHGLSLDFQDSKGRSLIHYSAWTGNLEHFDFFVNQELDFAKRDIWGWTALHFAVANEQVEMTLRLLDMGLDASAVDNRGRAVLQVAARVTKAPAILKLLLGRGASLTVKDCIKSTLLHEAAQNKNGAAIIQYLLDLELDVNAVTIDFVTPLHIASLCSHKESIEILLKNGAKLDVWSITGTPLNQAAQMMNIEIAKRYIEEGADPYAKDCLGKSSHYWLASYPPFMEELMLEPTLSPEDPSLSKSLILQSMAQRVRFILQDEYFQSLLTPRLGRQLMLLGDDESAVVAFSRNITSRHHSRVVTWLYRCDGCYSKIGPRFVCRSCALISFCLECGKGNRSKRIPWCHDHEFLKVPADGWSDLPEGKFDSAGRTFVEWLKDLQVRYDLST
jgi:ankyrin repeat protein